MACINQGFGCHANRMVLDMPGLANHPADSIVLHDSELAVDGLGFSFVLTNAFVAEMSFGHDFEAVDISTCDSRYQKMVPMRSGVSIDLKVRGSRISLGDMPPGKLVMLGDVPLIDIFKLANSKIMARG